MFYQVVENANLIASLTRTEDLFFCLDQPY